ncbi:hypothetical protein WAG28_20175 [Bacillus cereus]|uniref:HEAT repeat domain-containing protein n=1 Tax=Bacillus cereus TaxID=1396 RepID=UPI003012DEA4
MEELKKMLVSTNINERDQAIEKIIKSNLLNLREDLINIIEHGPTYAKVGAAKAFSQIATEEDIVTLKRILKMKSWHIRVEALHGIYKVLGANSIEALTPLLKDKAYGVRVEVEKILDQLTQKNKS